jgi:hypothetical protein
MVTDMPKKYSEDTFNYALKLLRAMPHSESIDALIMSLCLMRDKAYPIK